MRVYFDNAATTPLDPEVFEAMKPFMLESFGNPSSIHSHGREAKAAIEKARKSVASLLNTSPSEIFFTSGGTESDNTFLQSSIETFSLKHAISSAIEHHAVLHTLEALKRNGTIELSLVKLDPKGNVDLENLEVLLQKQPYSLVSLIHANNEIGNITPIEDVAELCKKYGAIFHSDTVQGIGHYKYDLQKLNINSIVGAAHKFHGPKGVGFIYINNNNKILPLIQGGAQERNMRGGTENVYGIVGLAKAMEIAYRQLDTTQDYILKLKSAMIAKLIDSLPGVEFNGESANLDRSLYTVLNVSLPVSKDNDMLLFNLDINRISASGGSACSSGSDIGSHVLQAINSDPNRGAIRFSFSKYNTLEEVDYVVNNLVEIFKPHGV